MNFRKENSEYLKEPDSAKVKMLKMFIPKLEKLIEEEKDKDHKIILHEQITFLKHSIHKDLKDYRSYFDNIKSNMTVYQFSEHIDGLAELISIEVVYNEHRDEIVQLFFDILNEQCKDNTIANYNMQKNFLKAIIPRIEKSNFQATLDYLRESNTDSISKFIEILTSENQENGDFLKRYLKTLARYLQKFLVENKDKFRSKNYIILSLDVFKCLIDHSTSESRSSLRPLVSDFISTAVSYYKNTLTLADELLHIYLDDDFFREIVVSQMSRVLESTDDNSTLCSLTYQKMLVEMSGRDVRLRSDEECLQLVNSFLEVFNRFEEVFYKEQKKITVEKGDRIANDNYLYAACEVLRVGTV